MPDDFNTEEREMMRGMWSCPRSMGGAVATRRRGFALFAALVALLLLALLAVGAMHLGRGDFRRTRDEAAMRRATNAADAGAYDIMGRWARVPHETVVVGGQVGPDSVHLTGAHAVTRTTRTARQLWWTVSEGEAGDSLAGTLARRTVRLAYRLALPEPVLNAAVVARDSVTLAGAARVVGTDTALATWGGLCAMTSHAAALAMPDTTRLCDGSCGHGSAMGRAVGLPALLNDTTAADTIRYRVFGGETWGTLTQHATLVLPAGSIVTPAPAIVSGVCDRSRVDNWGDPGGTSACATYAPLIWARGDLEVRGGTGGGVLLVDGDLTLSGGARVVGLAIVRDDVRSSGVGGTLLGGVLAGDATVAPGDHSRLDGSTLVQRSRCAIDLALEWSARLVPVRRRAWAALR
jgi:hypothetical protein